MRGQQKIEYALSLDAAKEIAMTSGSLRGKQARRHFLDVERRFNVGEGPRNQSAPDTRIEPVASYAVADDTALTVLEFVVLKGVPDAVAMAHAELWEIDLLIHMPLDDDTGVLRHPILAAKLFRRPILSAWWATMRGEAFKAVIANAQRRLAS